MHNQIIDKYYPEDNDLRNILITHSTLVMQRAVRICDAHPELHIDRQFVIEAAMLHDIGIFRCHAPSIHCMGDEPYICHGRIGAELMRAEGYPRHARVCERHTGAGLTKHDIISVARRGLSARNHRGEGHLLCRQVLLQDPSQPRKEFRRGPSQSPEVRRRGRFALPRMEKSLRIALKLRKQIVISH